MKRGGGKKSEQSCGTIPAWEAQRVPPPSSLQRTLSWLEIQTNKILFYRESTASGALLMRQYGGKNTTLRSQSSPTGKATGLSDNQEQHKCIHSPTHLHPRFAVFLVCAPKWREALVARHRPVPPHAPLPQRVFPQKEGRGRGQRDVLFRSHLLFSRPHCCAGSS